MQYRVVDNEQQMLVYHENDSFSAINFNASLHIIIVENYLMYMSKNKNCPWTFDARHGPVDRSKTRCIF